MRLAAFFFLPLLSLTWGLPPHSDDDFGFEDLQEATPSEAAGHRTAAPQGTVRKDKGVPDAVADVGRLFEFRVPADAFVGDIKTIEVKSPLPPWLSYTQSVFLGIPLSLDKPNILVSVVAQGANQENKAHDVFRIQIRQKPTRFVNPYCTKSSVILIFYIDEKLETIKPQDRVTAVKNISGFLGLNASEFYLSTQKQFLDASDSSVKLAGPGNLKKYSSKQPTTIELHIGCNNGIWKKYESLVNQIKEQALDGTLSEVLSLPLLGWRVILRPNTLDRGRRNTYDEEYDYDLNYDEMYEDEDEDDDGLTTIIPTTEKIIVTSQMSTIQDITGSHPHRHHHGEIPNISDEIHPEITIPDEVATVKYTTPLLTSPRIQDTTKLPETTLPDNFNTNYDDEDNYDDDFEEITELPTTLSNPTARSTTEKVRTTVEDIVPIETTWEDTTTSTTTERSTTVLTTKVDEVSSTVEESSPTTEAITETTVPSTILTTPSTTTTTTTEPTTTEFITSTVQTSTTEGSTVIFTSPTTTTTTTTTTPTTTTEIPTTSERTTVRTTTETIEYGFKNFPPQILHRLKKIHITAGTVLRYTVPENTFQDIEDGSNLQLKFIDLSEKKNTWIHFDEATREVYGLPLEEHVSKYDFQIQAMDKDGANVSDTLEVIVQQHKGSRTVTHEFILQLRVEKKAEFTSPVDWQLHTLTGLSRLFNNKDMSQIVVRSIDVNQDFVTFSWTNDTLPKSYCPKNELDYILSVMTANDEGDPSFALSQYLAPQLRVKRVEYRGIGQCEEKPELPIAPPKANPTNFSPIPRNQVDHINATEGELLIFKVPDDTFYDPEDGNARNLKMSLLTMDRKPLPKDHWLQFDVKNQEFYGVPLTLDIGRSEYQLVCEDRGGLTANDGLVVVVNPAPRISYNVEFTISLEIPYEIFINSANHKRKFVEKLQEVFHDKDTTHIHIQSISEGSTIVSWNNKSLPTDRCPNSEIKRLRRVLINDDETLPDRIYNIFDNDLQVKSISLLPIGICQGETTIIHSPDNTYPDESAPAESSDEYLITFVVPAVIIAGMLILAGIVACVLYRRRRSGKMNVEDERQTFRNKGIPVIFQDEIDEKPESGTKAPVILKEEKPPLAPPEYSKGNTPVPEENSDAPYQPPPPFTTSQDSGRQPRPKPTPTYRKPPPYVPP